MSLESFEYISKKLHRRKGKCEIYSRQKEVYIKVKQQKVTINHSFIAEKQMENEAESNFQISNDIWYHISQYIEPDDVQRFALICKKTASLVSSRGFWRSVYTRYCCNKSGSGLWNLTLPSHLQWSHINKCILSELRMNVIQALFVCYQPFNERLAQGYSLDYLLERTCVATWQKQSNCTWITCYKFWNHLKGDDNHKSVEEYDGKMIVAAEDVGEVVDDWESISTNKHLTKFKSQSALNPNEGFSILAISNSNFIPIPTQLMYQESRYRLKATRRLLNQDMRALNLELDFADSTTNGPTITVKYPNTQLCKVLPWWHPYYEKFINYKDQ